MMNEKEINDFLTNDIVMTAIKSVPFKPSDLMNSLSIGENSVFESGESIEAQSLASLRIFGNSVYFK